jgi:hypothetical protein
MVFQHKEIANSKYRQYFKGRGMLSCCLNVEKMVFRTYTTYRDFYFFSRLGQGFWLTTSSLTPIAALGGVKDGLKRSFQPWLSLTSQQTVI